MEVGACQVREGEVRWPDLQNRACPHISPKLYVWDDMGKTLCSPLEVGTDMRRCGEEVQL